ncbi:MAG: redox-sensing transcriptional repressor Rex [Tissierellia bacterium]|nr:redox-sensing transcriptional repressor Rex [Tissierellia bacterium]
MKKQQKISSAVVRRLPKYFRHLSSIEKTGMEKISSQQLSEQTGFTASQIRQDLNHFGGFGQQGYGYRVSDLKKSITEIIGLDKEYNVVIVGFGRIGQAIYNYRGFDFKKFEVISVFDVPAKVGDINGVQVKSIHELKEFVKNNKVDIIILTVPVDEAQRVCDSLEEGDVKGIWNFAPVDVTTKANIPVESVHLSESLYSLIYYMWNVEQYNK